MAKYVTVEFDPSITLPSYDGPLCTDVRDGTITWPDGSETVGHTFEEYLEMLKERYPQAVSERDSCERCGR